MTFEGMTESQRLEALAAASVPAGTATPTEPEPETAEAPEEPATPPKRFDEFPIEPAILEALEKMGFTAMTPVQEQAIPKLLTSTDFIGQAPTGTGKTAAFGIPLVQRVDPTRNVIQAVILAPTRELVQQIAAQLNEIGQVKGVNTLAIFGGENIRIQREKLRQHTCHIIAGTPGRVLDFMRSMSMDVTEARLAVLDEADVMLDMGFIQDISEILGFLPGGRETWMFSATLPPPIRRIADDNMYYPQEIKVIREINKTELIEQIYYVVNPDDKMTTIHRILKANPDFYGIVFCQTKRDVFQLTRKMIRTGYPLDCLHGGMEQYERDKVMLRFRNQELKLLISTDVVGRGIDIDKLTHIINFDPPHDLDAYIHRIGRTARKGETGIAITFFTPDQSYIYRQLEKHVGAPMKMAEDCELSFDLSAEGSGSRNRRRGRGPGKPPGMPPHAHTHGHASMAVPGNPDANAAERKRRRPRRRRKPGEGGGEGAAAPATQSPE